MSTRHRRWPVAIGACVGAVVAGSDQPLLGQSAPSQFGDPLPGLLPAEFERFRVGLDDFLEVETAEEGLGPSFNAASCAVCHNVPAIGGVSLVSEVRAAYRDAQGRHSAAAGADGTPLDTLFHLFSNPTHGCQPAFRPKRTSSRGAFRFRSFGAGLVEAIPDETIAGARGSRRSQRRRHQRPRGAGHRSRTGRAARRPIRLEGAARDAADVQRRRLPQRDGDHQRDVSATSWRPASRAAQMRLCDPIPDPEDLPDPRTRLAAIDNFEAFMKFLAPPPRGPIDDAARAGEQIFTAIGCALVPRAGRSQTGLIAPSAVRSRKRCRSFLICCCTTSGPATASRRRRRCRRRSARRRSGDLRVRRPLLHDGSASTTEDAVRRHQGEAAGVRRRFEQLTDAQRGRLISFLNSL